MQGGGGVRGSGPQTDKQLPQSPFTGNFLDDDILHCLLLVLSFYDSTQPKKGKTSPKLILSGSACVSADGILSGSACVSAVGSWRAWGMLDESVYVVKVPALNLYCFPGHERAVAWSVG